ncbi:MAG: sigma factor-like helix-turn-helix DNA-binding protein [Bdellovibrionota bacterium]
MDETRVNKSTEDLIACYGDMMFDLCESLLLTHSNAQILFRSIAKEIEKTLKSNRYELHERQWVLKVTCTKLISAYPKYTKKLSASDQMELDSVDNVPGRLEQLHYFLHRLPPEDQIILLLRDKYGLPYQEISAAMQTPEGSIKVRRQHSLRNIEDWIWGYR